MIEKIARRAGGFASTTAMRWLGGAQDAIPDVPLPHKKEPGTAEKLRGPATASAIASAVALISSSKIVRKGVEKGLRSLSDTVRPDRSSKGSSKSSKSRSSKANSNGSRSKASSNGSSHGRNGHGSLSAKSRTELYEMAKKKNIPGRSGMSKEELTKALSS